MSPGPGAIKVVQAHFWSLPLYIPAIYETEIKSELLQPIWPRGLVLLF